MSETNRTIEIPLMQRAATVSAVEGEANVYEAVYATGAAVRRYDYRQDEPYIEVLSMQPSAIRTQRLDSGIVPILLDHHQSVRSQSGVVERHWITDGMGHVQFRMETGTEQADAINNKLQQRIVRAVSVGAKVHKFVESRNAEGVLVRTAVDWEPYEISIVSMPADAGAVIRSDEVLHRCEVEVAGDTPAVTPATATTERSDTMTTPTVTDSNLDTARATELETARSAAAEQARKDERARVAAITEVVRKAKLGSEFAEKLIADGTSLDAARAAVLDAIADADDATATSTVVQVGRSYDDPAVIRAALVDAFAHQMNPALPIEGKALEFRSATMLSGFHTLERAHGRDHRFDKEFLAERSLQGTSDFPIILADAAHRVVLGDYQAATPAFRTIARQRNFSDFRPHKVLRSGEFPALQPLSEHGEIKSGSLNDAQVEEVNLETKAIRIGITRRLLVNDSIGAIADMISKQGRRIAAQENSIAWGVLLANPKMSDGKAVFHADHKNLHGSVVATPDLAALSASRTALRKHTSDGIPLNFTARYLIVPTDLETEAEKLMTAILATKEGDVNVFSGKLQIVCDPAMDDHNAWYVATSPADAEVLTYGYLNGASGPKVQTKEGWTVDGAEMRIIHDFGVGITGEKGIYKFRRQ